MTQAGFDPPGEKWQLCLNIVVILPPKPPRLDQCTVIFHNLDPVSMNKLLPFQPQSATTVFTLTMIDNHKDPLFSIVHLTQ